MARKSTGKVDDACRVPTKIDPVIEAITGRIGPTLLILMLTCQPDESMADDAVELLCHLVEQLVIVAVHHGAPTTPEWWDFVGDHLTRVAEHLEAQGASPGTVCRLARQTMN